MERPHFNLHKILKMANSYFKNNILQTGLIPWEFMLNQRVLFLLQELWRCLTSVFHHNSIEGTLHIITACHTICKIHVLLHSYCILFYYNVHGSTGAVFSQSSQLNCKL